MRTDKPKRKPGRPQHPLRPLLEQKVLDGIRAGMTLRKAAAAAGVALSTVQRWEDDERYAVEVKAAVAEREAEWLQLLRETEKGWQRFAWLLERTNPADYGRRVYSEIQTDEVTHLLLEVVGQDAADDDEDSPQ